MRLNKYAQFIRYLAEAPADGGGDPPATPATPVDDNNIDGGELPPVDVKPDSEGETKDDGGEGDNGDEVSVDFAKLELPEGMELDQSAVDAFGPLMNEAKFTQEQAQQFASAFAEFRQAQAQDQGEAFSNQKESWFNESKSDKEFGGDKFDESSKLAVQAIEKFGSPELKELMDNYGIGNNPEMIRFMYRVGKATQEDTPGNGGNGPTGAQDRVSVLYPTK